MHLIPFLVIADITMTWLCGYSCLLLVAGWSGRSSIGFTDAVSLLMSLCAIAFPLFVRVYGGYERRSIVSLGRSVQRVLTAWGTVFVLMLVILWANKLSENFSRLWMGLWFCTTTVLLVLGQIVYYFLLRWIQGAVGSELRVLVVGSDNHAISLFSDINQSTHNGYHIVGYFGAEQQECPVPWKGGAENILQVLRSSDDDLVDEIWIMQSEATAELGRAMFVRDDLRLYQLRFVPSFQGFDFFGSDLERIGRHSLIGMSVSPQVGLQAAGKRAIDILGSALGLILFAPLFLIIALSIRWESLGGVFFSQQRHGRGGCLFKLWKFRSMTQQASSEQFVQAVRGDQRVTRVGYWLRRWSLDEIPQLWNVLLGSMSLVGPRPHPAQMNEDAVTRDFRYHLRHKVKPGMSGWAQVNGYRGETSDAELLDKRLEYDLYYINNWTLWLDIKILIMTVFVGFRHPNAY
ncbi:MAG: exopolysaccharide biosynthesis polyprenyl glycosylphosphotransferase [Oceanococcus sp.]